MPAPAEPIGLLPNWPVLSRLLDDALELPPGRRDAWLAALPSEHSALRGDLRRLLECAPDTSSDSFLATLPRISTLTSDAIDTSSPQPGETIGPWRLTRKIGEGGMAAVWLAERCDGLLGRPVAVKLPHGGWRVDTLSERIAREREILATLNHPNIARLLDAGTTEDQKPYIALEYVDGRRIDDYCREENAGLSKRLDLFLKVAGAIAYAHNMLVVHRDLKPSNILVTMDGEVRVLDFGIAKLLDGGQTHETELTRFGGRALTLDYASPEQIAGQPVTVASDVYSLGVVLYDLLTGARPYRLKRNSRAALEEAILEIEPRPPSEKVADRSLKKSLRGDLDTIVLKALKKDPSERYSTVEAFADDLRRFLETRPVLAQPDRLWYRCSKFVRRNRLAVLAASAVNITIIAGAATVAWQAQVALAQKRQAEQSKAFVLSILHDAHSYGGTGKPLSALDLLRSIQRRTDQLHKADPETRVELLNRLGSTLMSLQDTAGPDTALTRAVAESSALDQGHIKALRARMLRSWIRLFRGQIIEGRREVDQLVADMRRSRDALPDDLSTALRAQSALACADRDAKQAVASALEALQIAESRLGPAHNQSILALVELSNAYNVSGLHAPALETGERAYQRALAAYSAHRSHPNVVKARVAFGQALAGAGQLDRAITETTQAIQDAVSMFGPESRLVGLSLWTLARMEFDAGRTSQSLESVDRARTVLSAHLDQESPGYATFLELRGMILLAARRHTEALEDLRRAEKLALRTLGPLHPVSISIKHHRALAFDRVAEKDQGTVIDSAPPRS